MTLLEQIEPKEFINNTLNEIISIINEERGISDVVSNLTFRIKNTIINAIKNSKSLPINYDEVIFKKVYQKNLVLIIKILLLNGYIKEKNGQQTLDFYLPDYNIAIEYQGEQHFLKG